MSGFEIAGLIIGAYPIIMTLLAAIKETKTGRGARRLAWDLEVESAIFGDFVFNLLAPNVAEADLARLTDPNNPDLELWNGAVLQMKLKSRLGDEKAKIVVETLQEMMELLSLLQNELLTSNDDKTVGTMREDLDSFLIPTDGVLAGRAFYDDFVAVFETLEIVNRTPRSKSASAD